MKVISTLLAMLLLITACNEAEPAPKSPTQNPLPENIIWQTPSATIDPENTDQLQLAGKLNSHTATIFHTRFSEDGQRYLTIGGDRTLIVWDMQTGQPLLQIPDLDIKQAFFLPEDILLTVDAQDELIKWSLTEHRQLQSAALDQIFTAVTLSPDQEMIAVGSNTGTVTLYQTETLEPTLTIQAHQGGYQVASIYFAPDNNSIYTVGGEGSISRWLLSDGGFMQEIYKQYPSPITTAISPDRTVLAAIYPEELILFELERGRLLRSITVPFKEKVNELVFSPDGQWIAVGGEHDQVMLYDVETGNLAAGLPGHGTTFDGLAFSPDGHMLLTSSQQNGVFLWDLSSVLGNSETQAEQIQVPRAPLNQVPDLQIYGVDWSINNQQLVLIDARGSAFVLSPQ